MKVRRLDKLPKRKVTVDEILGLSDIQGILDDVPKGEIDELLVIYTSKDSFYWVANGISPSRVLWLIESMKHGLLGDKDASQE